MFAVAQGRSLAAYPLAKCLDGTPARYYLSKGSSNHVFVFFEGGGFCKDLADCQARASTYLGSSLQDPPTKKLDRPYFTRSIVDNPLLSSFTFAYVRYCDGGYFSGERSPVAYNGSTLHFNGRWITEALFADLRLTDAAHVVIGGCSAGGIRTLAHIDALRAMVPSSAAVVGFADSGFYMDVPFFTDLKRFVVSPSGQNATGLLNSACLAAHHRAEECLIAQRAVQFIRTPTFVWQSRYDADQKLCELSPACASSPQCVDAYARNLSWSIHVGLFGRHRPHHGAFIDTCERHCDDGLRLPLRVAVSGVTPFQAFAIWHRDLQSNQHLNKTMPWEQGPLWEMQGGSHQC